VQAVFHIVKTARDKVTEGLAQAWSQGETLQGWQLDRLARDYIVEKGYGDRFVHTTGHSLGYEVHAPGVGLNDLSSHDTRSVIPGIGLTVEPGIYLEDFGIRLELDVYIDPLSGPAITTPPQTELVLLG
jgi:Xaa-Pro aminopeptidase